MWWWADGVCILHSCTGWWDLKICEWEILRHRLICLGYLYFLSSSLSPSPFVNSRLCLWPRARVLADTDPPITQTPSNSMQSVGDCRCALCRVIEVHNIQNLQIQNTHNVGLKTHWNLLIKKYNVENTERRRNNTMASRSVQSWVIPRCGPQVTGVARKSSLKVGWIIVQTFQRLLHCFPSWCYCFQRGCNQHWYPPHQNHHHIQSSSPLFVIKDYFPDDFFYWICVWSFISMRLLLSHRSSFSFCFLPPLTRTQLNQQLAWKTSRGLKPVFWRWLLGVL